MLTVCVRYTRHCTGAKMGAKSELTTRQAAFVAALITGLTQTEAATVIGCGTSTARRYMGLPKVRSALQDAQTNALGDAVRKMNAGARDALDVLREIMQDKAMPPAVRVRAALGWLEAAFKARELLDLTVRLDDLERRLTNG